jgi:hypothetical protein
MMFSTNKIFSMRLIICFFNYINKFFWILRCSTYQKTINIINFFNSLIFFGLTDPPYKTFGDFFFFFLIKFIVSKRSFDFGINPVPIDQTGS